LNTRPFIVTDSFLFNAYYTASGATATICAPNKYNPETHLTQTLWVPQFSGNRTACLNLDHFVNNDGTGNNGNCMTEYRIYCVPWWFNERYLGILCARVAEAVEPLHTLQQPRRFYRVFSGGVLPQTLHNQQTPVYNGLHSNRTYFYLC
jgi:hypothetical protein